MAVEMKDGKKILVTPIATEDLTNIHIGDIVYLTGDITTCRDVAHRRVVEEGKELPVDVRNAAILHSCVSYVRNAGRDSHAGAGKYHTAYCVGSIRERKSKTILNKL